MNTKWHKETIEALGMLAPKKRIVNKLNAVVSHSDDKRLIEFAAVLINEILAANSNTEVMRPREMKNGVPTASKAIAYCKSLAYSD